MPSGRGFAVHMGDMQHTAHAKSVLDVRCEQYDKELIGKTWHLLASDILMLTV